MRKRLAVLFGLASLLAAPAAEAQRVHVGGGGGGGGNRIGRIGQDPMFGAPGMGRRMRDLDRPRDLDRMRDPDRMRDRQRQRQRDLPPDLAFRRRDQDAVLDARRAGRIRPLRDIEARIVPRMGGARYLGPEYDPDSATYRLKFMRGGSVIWLDVDGRTGAVLGRSGD